jgi:molybdopterin-guanine dinucleotide biosynthesis protein A
MKRFALILAGGESKRFGHPKGLMSINGVSLVLRLSMEASKAGIDDVRISANDGAFSQFGLPVIADVYPKCGPLSGIHAALSLNQVEEIVVLPCDTPGISAIEISTLLGSADENPDAEVVFVESPSGSHPLCSVVRKKMLPRIVSALCDERFSVNKLFHSVKHAKVAFDDEKPFRNINTPEDLKQLEVDGIG